MKLEKHIRSYDNSFINFRVTPKDFVSLFEGGYAINQDGEFITVKRDEKHFIIFEKYLNAFLGKSRDRIVRDYLKNDSEDMDVLDYFTIYGLLISLNHVLYFGLGKSIDNNNVNLVIPQDYETILTEEQKESCRKLLSTDINNNLEVTVCIWDSDFEMDVSTFLESLKVNKIR